MSHASPPPSGSGGPDQKGRRQFLKLFFWGSMASAGAALAYRLGQWSQGSTLLAQVPDAQQAESTLAPGSTTTATTVVYASNVTRVAAPDTIAPETTVATAIPPEAMRATLEPQPSRGSANPMLGETGIPSGMPIGVMPEHQQVVKPPIITQREWGGLHPTKGFLPQQPSRITLHHEGVIFDGSIPAPVYLQRVQTWSMSNRGWPDLPYHFLIDLEGLIYEGRPLTTRGDTNTAYNVQDHALVALLGKYDQGEQQPNQNQLTTIIALMAWIIDTYNISINTIRGHRDFIPVNAKGEHIDPKTHERITCPGDNLYRYLADGTIQRGIEHALHPRPTPTRSKDRFDNRQ